MAYPRSLWSSIPRDGFPPSPEPLSAPAPLALDDAGYPSYPFEDPDRTYSPAEFASKFPTQPPKYTQGEHTSVTGSELANAPSTSPQRFEGYPGASTDTDPATPKNTYLDASTKTYNSQQPQSVQDTQDPMLHFPRSVVALAASATTSDQPETVPNLVPSASPVNMELDSGSTPLSTTDVATNPATALTDMEARIIEAASKCNHLVGAYQNLAPDEETKRRAAMYLDQPPPYLSDEEEDEYRTQYESVFPAACYSLVRAVG